MKKKDGIKIIGMARLSCHNKDGSLVWDTGWMKNTLTTASLAVLTGLAGDVGTQTAFGYIAVGTDDTAESSAHTTLQAEITDSGLERAAVTPTRETDDETNDTLQFYKEWTATGDKDIEEIAVFNDDTAGVMFGRKLTGTKAVENGKTLKATYKFKFSV
jgi:hypothetical protein